LKDKTKIVRFGKVEVLETMPDLVDILVLLGISEHPEHFVDAGFAIWDAFLEITRGEL
jgi:hypothetical protein